MSEETKNETVVEETAVDSATEGAAPKKGKKKLPIILGVVAVVLIAAGAGFWVWHGTPSFCNAICHTPMDPYLPTYEAEAGAATTDKWGNEVANSNAMLAPTHRVIGEKMDSDIDCLACHVPTMSEQISEGIGWISGNYEVVENAAYGMVITEKGTEDLTEARGIEPDQFCLNEDCHNVTRDDLAQRTADMERNPHSDPHGTVQCSDCHKAHRASVNYCTQCHNDAEVPDGWLTWNESEALENTAFAA